MPFYESVYYPYGPEAGASFASLPSLMSSPPVQVSSSAAVRMPLGHLPAFKFRARHESVDWRRIGAIDVDRVASEVDFLTLQEHITNITFCNVENEKCPHCFNSVDPVLLKLLRLAQLTIEYLLHSQEYLTSNVQALEEKVHSSIIQTEQIKTRVARQAEEVRSLKDECKRRKKIISTQQMMIHAGANTYHKCQLCDKAFMNYSFLQSHVHRRHPEETAFEKQRMVQSDRLQSEINKLKEELLLTKCQLEAEQSAHVAKLSQDYEHQKMKEDEILKTFDKWKEEEREKLGEEMNKVKEMFMKEFQELTSKNDALEKHLVEIQKTNMQGKSNLGTLKDCQPHDFEEGRTKYQQENLKELLEKQERKWTSRMQQLYQEHEKEKNQLLLQMENLRSTMTDDQQESNIFYKKRIDELDRRLKEQSELISSHKEEMAELSIKHSGSFRRFPVTVPTVQHIESKSSASTTCLAVPTVLPVESKSSASFTREEKIEATSSISKQRLINTLKNNPSLIKELRSVLEQSLVEKLESLGVKSGIRGIPSDHLSRILVSVECQREEKEKELPEIQQIREHLVRQMSIRLEEKVSTSSLRYASASQLFPEDSQKMAPLESLSSVSLSRPVKSRSKMKQFSQDALSTEQRKAINEKTTMSNKTKKNLHSDLFSKTPSGIGTPPFSSDDELEEENSLHSYQVPKQLQLKPSTSNKSSTRIMSAQSDSELSDDSQIEECDLNIFQQQNLQKEVSAKPAKATVVKELTKQIEKKISAHGNEKKPIGGVDVTQAFLKKDEVKELKLTDLDDDNWDISSLEEEKSLISKSEKDLYGSALQKNDLSIQNKSAWGSTKLLKGEVREADTPSTLKSSLVTVTDLSSDCLDI
ncbi:zinc finger protein DZIP1 isoform X2 [Rhinatrema bivittatum]|uniref:zinc finger protein DZIP1 isoform X2 n=1 Tax=Rhinatrema bivittatum TaxID=194408 RepID=UPI001127F2FE|nr:zinc finger protein DZIP1 isoform X2 [Rhinatrema bivittatum]